MLANISPHEFISIITLIITNIYISTHVLYLYHITQDILVSSFDNAGTSL